jgi:flagellar biosynthesis/type III secretory pathway M-ring protein FliF/YscJ
MVVNTANLSFQFSNLHRNKHFHAVVFVVVCMAVITFVVSYQLQKARTLDQPIDSGGIDQARMQKLNDISQSFTTEPSPQQKAKLESMTKSFNN